MFSDLFNILLMIRKSNNITINMEIFYQSNNKIIEAGSNKQLFIYLLRIFVEKNTRQNHTKSSKLCIIFQLSANHWDEN